jgi:hypothetical protein
MEYCKRMQEPDEKQGIIVQSFTRDNGTVQTTNATTTQQQQQQQQQHLPQQQRHSNKSASSSSWNHALEEYCGVCCGDNTHAAAEVASYIVPEMSGCYFVHYPTHKKRKSNAPSTSSSQPTNRHGPKPYNNNNSILEQSSQASPPPKPGMGGEEPPLGNSPNEHSSSASTVSSLSSRDLSGIHDDSSQDEGGRRNKLL